MASISYNYARCLAIVHGKSEYDIVKYIHTNLHLNVQIYAKDKGRGSIQINGLNDLLEKPPFNSLKTFADKFVIEYDRKTKTLKNFRLYIIMDTDDCDEDTKSKYISGELFSGSKLKDYIIPIYNIMNLEDVMMKARIMTEKIERKDKGTYYSKVFPINTSPMSIDTINQVAEFAKKLLPVQETNMEQFAKYCYKLATGKEIV